MFSNAMESIRSIESLDRLASRYGHATLRSQPPGRRGPVLAYVPTYEALEDAAGMARDSYLCVVEGSTSMAGWASAVGAEDLLRPGQTAAPLDPDLAKELDSLVFYGNNGWGDQFGKQQARRLLANLRPEWRDSAIICGYMLAKGRSAQGVKNLTKIMEKAA
ncbi:hypothetical protein [Nonomuraea sp. NPDC049129]|uniref:hypothetical protein n=1 Tax=Nonomuraea sp. NPDC049129 TaxID=3155272 RepID=UPI0033D77FF6